MTTLAAHKPSPLQPSLPQSSGASSTEGLRSSGTSPGAQAAPFTVHLVGAGKVGRAFLREIAHTRARVVAVSDSTATVFLRQGLDAAAVAAHKEESRSLADLGSAQRVPIALAASLVRADVVVDASPSDPDLAEASLARCRTVLRAGSRLALAAKSALAIAAEELLDPALADRVGCNAALGGTGARLARELPFLRDAARGVALVGNASTTALFEAFEEGLDLDAALARCRARGVLEPDPSLDLDGTDAAQKLAIVARAVLGLDVDLAEIEREDVRAIDPTLVWWHAQRGRTTRLVARATRDGGLRVACEELSRSSPLAVPSDRVAYAYELDSGRWRVHLGAGIGPLGSARALLADVDALARNVRTPGIHLVQGGAL